MLQVLTKLEAGAVWNPPNSKLGLTQYARHSDLKAALKKAMKHCFHHGAVIDNI